MVFTIPFIIIVFVIIFGDVKVYFDFIEVCGEAKNKQVDDSQCCGK